MFSNVHDHDQVAVEEPLEIRLQFGRTTERTSRSLSITMRTPGEDFDLAVGFLLSEGLIRGRADLHVADGAEPSAIVSENVVRVSLAPEVAVNFEKLQRHFYTTSSCGLCGKASLEALEWQGFRSLADVSLRLAPRWIADLPARLRAAQQVFSETGGLHAAGLFAAGGDLEVLCEDVGRHNAVDKVFGKMLIADRVPLFRSVLVVSGRASLELVQKTVAAQVPVMVAIGAPSSLAVECAMNFGVTLIGFAAANRFNCYSHPQRLATELSAFVGGKDGATTIDR